MGVLSALSLVAAAAGGLPTKEIVPGVQMPKVSIGTFTWGSVVKKESAQKIVSTWLAQGFRGVDTALVYLDQSAVATAIKESGVPREEIFITTKILGCAESATSVDYDLKRLNTDYIDLLLIHEPWGTVGHCAKTWQVLEDYVAQGKLKSIGVSNFDVKQLQRILDVATVPVAVNQMEYNVFHHNEDVIAFCDANNITVEAWSPLNGAHDGRSVFKEEAVLGIAAKHNVSAAQVALRWIVQRGHTLTVLTSDPTHQANDADLWSFELEDGEMDTLTQLKDKTVVV